MSPPRPQVRVQRKRQCRRRTARVIVIETISRSRFSDPIFWWTRRFPPYYLRSSFTISLPSTVVDKSIQNGRKGVVRLISPELYARVTAVVWFFFCPSVTPQPGRVSRK